MSPDKRPANRRILVVDDNRAIHEDFRKILGPALADVTRVRDAEALLFGDAEESNDTPCFQVDSAFQGQEGAELVRRACEAHEPYAMAFVDARMPPGWDGIETAARIWEHDPEVQVVICTAYSDYSWKEIRRKLVRTDRLVILKKPFDNDEILQLADALTTKWQLAREDRCRIEELERRISERGRDRQAMERIDTQLETASRRRAGMKCDTGEAADEQAMRQRALEHALRESLRNGELSLHYQPLVDIASRRVVSLEALLRWHSPSLGAVSPAEFIPIAEQSGLIVPIGEFVLKSACEQIVRWGQQGIAMIPVAVNLSALQIEHQPVLDLVRGILKDTRLLPHYLALELTESVFMKNVQRHAPAFRALREAGVRIQIDDFGTGYSSLSYLKNLPFDTLKIDRSFIRQLDVDSTDEAIVSAILAMARSLSLRVVAEGVETPAQLEVLGRHGCELAQGFYFCRPLPADQIRQLLADLAERASFTDTLRIRTLPAPEARLSSVEVRSSRAGTAR